jgi:hypothetical protein
MPPARKRIRNADPLGCRSTTPSRPEPARAMQRLRDYCGILAWQTGIGYLLLWAVTYSTLADGAAVFGQSGVCHADSAQTLFHWACYPSSRLANLADVANFA